MENIKISLVFTYDIGVTLSLHPDVQIKVMLIEQLFCARKYANIYISINHFNLQINCMK